MIRATLQPTGRFHLLAIALALLSAAALSGCYGWGPHHNGWGGHHGDYAGMHGRSDPAACPQPNGTDDDRPCQQR